MQKINKYCQVGLFVNGSALFTLEIDSQTTIEEILEHTSGNFKTNIPIQNWACYSSKNRKYLHLNRMIEQDDNLYITTSGEVELNIQINTNINYDRKMAKVYSLDNTIMDIKDSTYKYLAIDKNQAKIEVYINNTTKEMNSKLRDLIYEDGFLSDTIEVRVNVLELKEIQTQYKMHQNIPICDSHFNNPVSQICTFNHNCQHRKICTLCPFDNHKGISKDSFIPFQIFAEQLNEQCRQSSNLRSLKDLINDKFKILEYNFIEILEKQKKNLFILIEDYERDFQLFEQLYQQLQSYPVFEFSNQQIENMIQIIFYDKLTPLQEKQFINLKIIEQIIQEYGKLQNKLSQDLQCIFEKATKFKNELYVDDKYEFLIELSLDQTCTFREILEYIQKTDEIGFQKYIYVFGPIKKWKGILYGKIINISETFKSYQSKRGDRLIKFGPFNIIIESQSQSQNINTKIYRLRQNILIVDQLTIIRYTSNLQEDPFEKYLDELDLSLSKQ